jgi:Meckel syndrome type 1 protein
MFNADAADAEAQTEAEIALEEEKLYQEYLTARAKQANSTADDAARVAAALPADQARLKAAEDAKAVAARTQTELEVQATAVVESTTERKHTKVASPAPPAVTQTANGESAPTTAKAPAPTPPVQTAVPAGTTQTQVPKPTGEAKQSWLISGAESNARSDAPARPPAVKPATATPAKPVANARPTPTVTNVDAAKVSAAERAKKLEQRLRAVQARRHSDAAAIGANATSKIDTNPAAAKPKPDSTSVAATATPRPPAAPAAATPAPVRGPATPQTLTAPTAAKTDDMSTPSPSKPTSVALDTEPDQSQTVDKTTTPEPKKVNGSDTVPPASDTIEVPAAKEAVRTPSTTATAKADLEAALQALNSKTPETNPAILTPTESGDSADQADAVPQELLDPNTQAPLGDLTQNSGLGCTEKECPNCTALVPMDADGCGCGFTFPPKDDALPSLSLSDSDVEALQKRKKSSDISHLG